MEPEQEKNLETNNNSSDSKPKENKTNVDLIMDLPKLSMQTNITNSDIILAIFEICTFNKKYNYECSNNTKAFWDRVVKEGILKKIFKNFKSETLRKYWKIIRQTQNNEKFMEIVRKNENYIIQKGLNFQEDKEKEIILQIIRILSESFKNLNFGKN